MNQLYALVVKRISFFPPKEKFPVRVWTSAPFQTKVSSSSLPAGRISAKNKIPPRSHDLLALAALLQEEFPEKQMKIIDELHDVSVPLRYPDDLDEALEAYTYDEVKRIGENTQELIEWLKQKLN